MKIRFIILLLFVGLCFPGALLADSNYQGPEDEKAIKAAQNALLKLGKNRGGIPVTGKTIEIVGIKPISIKQISLHISKDLEDLGARQVGTEIQISMSGDVLFDFDKWDVKKEAEPDLLKLARGIEKLDKKRVIIEGHTDSKGSEDYNMKLSQRRADAIKAWFISTGGLENMDFETKGFGEAKPIDPNTRADGSDNPEGRAKNRRVEIRIP